MGMISDEEKARRYRRKLVDLVRMVEALEKHDTPGNFLAATREAGLIREMLELEAQLGQLPIDDLVYVPGDWVCPDCFFILHSRTLSAMSGAVGINQDEPEPCPRCHVAMRQMTYKQDAEMANRLALDLAKQNQQLLDRLYELEPKH